jgi:hypothetical protein
MKATTKNISGVQNTRTIEYHRKPTTYEIKFGYGATHYLSVDSSMCSKPDGTIKKRWKNPIDGLIYTQNYTS